MTALTDACADLAAALPRAEALIAIPDTDGTTGRGQPSSRPPWNQAAATALLDAAEGTRQIEAAWRSHAAGRPAEPLPMARTGEVLASLPRLAHALPPCPGPERDENTGRQQPCRCQRCDAVRSLTRWATAILQLPAVDREERPQRVTATCPYCGFAMLRVYPRSGRVTCLRFGACEDSDGSHPAGLAGRSALNGEPMITWNDGLVT